MAVQGGPAGWPSWLLKKLAQDTKAIGKDWYGGWLLGQGGEGLAALWVAFDDSNRVARRMVAKTLSSTALTWWQTQLWHDGLGATGYQDFNAPINHQLPKEAIVHQRLSTLSDPPPAPMREYPICNYQGHSAVDERNRRWKLFLEFCPLGELEDLVDLYADSTPPTPFPEEFVWYVAHECLVAAQVMSQGSTAAPRPDWRGIVHRDLKLCNIFLASRDPDRFRYYPKIKVADFGFAAETDANDPGNPIDYADGAGTYGWVAPEQMRWYRKNGNLLLDKRLSEKTNVWAIGLICWTLMYLQHAPAQLSYHPDQRAPAFGPTPSGYVYTPALEQFVLDCTEFVVAERFDITQALNSITANDGFADMDTAVPMGHLSRDDNPNKLEWFPQDNKYRLRLTRQQLPRVV